jgi:aldose 1-epimerase
MMAQTMTLSDFDFELSVTPNAGGGISRLDWRGLPLLRPAIEGAIQARDPLGLACFPMTPYVSRISDGVFSWGDVTTKIAPNMAGGSHPLHGIGWRRPWDIVSQSSHHVSIGFNHDGDADWPWAFQTWQDFSLHHDHVQHVLSVRSTDPRPFPSSLGPHPYFPGKNARIQFSADALWEISGESLPTHMATPQVVSDLKAGVGAQELDLDHCFEGWNGVAHISWPTHRLTIAASCALDGATYPCTRLQLYTPKGEDYFCLEPVTARCVAFGEPDPRVHGVVELTDQTLSITTRYRPQLAA